jgi:hypothetical protein
MNVRTLAALGVPALVGGCFGHRNDDALEAATAADMEELARAVDTTTGSLGDAAEVSASGEFDGVGDCAWSWSVEGPSDGATLAAGITNTPCGGTISGARGSIDYQVTLGEIGGTLVRQGPGAWDYDLTGDRTADTTITSTRRGSSETYTGAWSLESLIGSADGTGEGPFDAVLAYTGWFGGEWDLTWSRSADGAVEGTLVGPGGRSCAASGTTDAVDVVCDD